MSLTHHLPLHLLPVGAEPVLEVCESALELVPLLVAVALPEVEGGAPMRRVESPVARPVLGDVGVADELLRAEEPLALEALHAARLGVDGRLGQQDPHALAEALVLNLQEINNRDACSVNTGNASGVTLEIYNSQEHYILDISTL